MFETLPNPSLEMVLMVGRAALLIGAFWVFALAFVRWRRADERDTAFLHNQIERTFAEVRSLHETIAVLGARLEAMSERSDVDSRLVVPTGSQRGYDVATRMARNGSGVEELIASSGITRHEAELLVRLHGMKAREAAAAPARNAERQQPVSWPIPTSNAAESAPAQAKQNAARKRGSLLSVVG